MKIIIAEDEIFTRELIADLFEGHEVILVGDGDKLIEKYREFKPDLLIVDINMPNKSGLDAIKEIGETSTKIIVLTAIEDRFILRELSDYADGIFLKGREQTAMFLEKVKIILSGNVVLGESVKEKLSRKSGLTEREYEVVSLIKKGLTSKEIAEKLFLSVNTIHNHRRNILEKLNVHNTAELISEL